MCQNRVSRAASELRVADVEDGCVVIGWDLLSSLGLSVADLSRECDLLLTPIVSAVRVASRVRARVASCGNSSRAPFHRVDDLIIRQSRIDAFSDPELIIAAMHGRALLGNQHFAIPLLGGGPPNSPGWITVQFLEEPEPSSLEPFRLDISLTAIDIVDADCSVASGAHSQKPAFLIGPHASLSAALRADLPGTETAVDSLAKIISDGAGSMRSGALLIEGKTGSGKSWLAKALVQRLPPGTLSILVTAADVFSGGGEGSSETRVRALIRSLRGAHKARQPALVVVDDAELLMPRNPGGHSGAVVSRCFLDAMDAAARWDASLWLLLTSHSNQLEPSAWGPTRIRHVLQLHAPNDLERCAQAVAAAPADDYVAARAAGLGAIGFSRADIAATALNARLIEKAPLPASQRWASAVRALRDASLRRLPPGSPPPFSSHSLFSIAQGAKKAMQVAVTAVLTPLATAKAVSALTSGASRAGGCRGLLISGRAGEGKTAMAHALARAAISRGLATARVLTAIDIVSPLVGATEAAIAALFAAARTAAPCLVIIDGLDVLSPARRRDDDGADGANSRASGVTATLLAELDGVLASGGVSLIGIVRDAKRLDAAMTRPGRLDVHVELRAPDDSERAALIESAPGGSPAALRWKARVGELVAFTRGWSRADTVDLWRSAAMTALRRATADAPRESVLVTDEDIDASLAAARTSNPSENGLC